MTIERTALKHAAQALDDWLHVYAPEHCHAEHVAETQHRIMLAGGLLAYIAGVRQEIREALGE